MRKKTRIWLGIGACVMASGGMIQTSAMLGSTALASSRVITGSDDGGQRVPLRGIPVAQHSNHGGEAGQGGEAGGEGGARNLPPDLDFALKIALIRGHLRVGDELVQGKQWAAALPHFLHPTEEIYNGIRDKLSDYKTPPFEVALKSLANLVKSKKGGADYAAARKLVDDALAAADAGLKEKQKDASFALATALQMLKVATGEYEQAIVKGRFAKPVEYQDARGFVWEAERLIDGVAAELEKKDAEAFRKVRAGFAELKKAWPAAVPPRKPVKDHGKVLADVSRIELAAGPLM